MPGISPQDPVAILASLEPGLSGTVVVAVSGGSDSTALLWAAQALSKHSYNALKVVAVTVDHALREGSAREAARVAEVCRSLGVEHITRRWVGPKPVSGIQAQARDMRRRLLCEVAASAGASAILTGHTLNDQLETVAMRQRRGDGPGLAGIAPASLGFKDTVDGSGIWFVRPYLGTSRQALQDWLSAQNVLWSDDPSNDNLDFERVAVRRELANAGPERELALQFVQSKTAIERVQVAREAARLLSFYASEPFPGLIKLNPGVFQSAHLPAISGLIRVLIAHAGSATAPADPAMADFIVESAMRIGFGSGRKPSRRACSGALIDVRKDGVWFMREKRRPVALGLPFDGRYRTTVEARSPRGRRSEFGKDPIAASLASHAVSSEPVYVQPDGTSMSAFEAAQNGEPLRRLINPWPDIVPGFDLKLAEKLSLMIGEGPFPPCPVHPDGKK